MPKPFEDYSVKEKQVKLRSIKNLRLTIKNMEKPKEITYTQYVELLEYLDELKQYLESELTTVHE